MTKRVEIDHRKKHGMSGSPTYRSWWDMLNRCRNPKAGEYRNYGGRGVTVCERWQQFQNFLTDMGERPLGTSLDRVNVNGRYEPSNCRWATLQQQNRNTRRCRYLTFDGREQTVAAWAEERGLSRETLATRLRLGWPVELAISTPRNDPAAAIRLGWRSRKSRGANQ